MYFLFTLDGVGDEIFILLAPLRTSHGYLLIGRSTDTGNLLHDPSV